MKHYALHEKPDFLERQTGMQLGACVCEGNNREDVITEAEEFYCQQMIEDCEYGEYSRDALLVIYDDDEETVEEITLSWVASDDGYVRQHSLTRSELGIL